MSSIGRDILSIAFDDLGKNPFTKEVIEKHASQAEIASKLNSKTQEKITIAVNKINQKIADNSTLIDPDQEIKALYTDRLLYDLDSFVADTSFASEDPLFKNLRKITNNFKEAFSKCKNVKDLENLKTQIATPYEDIDEDVKKTCEEFVSHLIEKTLKIFPYYIEKTPHDLSLLKDRFSLEFEPPKEFDPHVFFANTEDVKRQEEQWTPFMRGVESYLKSEKSTFKQFWQDLLSYATFGLLNRGYLEDDKDSSIRAAVDSLKKMSKAEEIFGKEDLNKLNNAINIAAILTLLTSPYYGRNDKMQEDVTKLLNECGDFPPALILKEYDFTNPNTISNISNISNKTLSDSDIRTVRDELISQIKKAGLEKFISQNDIDEIFTAKTTRAKVFDVFITLVKILCVPLVWTAMLLQALYLLLKAIVMLPFSKMRSN